MSTASNEPEPEPLSPAELERAFPSIPLGYNLAIASYETLLKRLENVDGKYRRCSRFP